ncbi:acyl carrier protein [Actinacidiphila epipremni]|jgi:acyl carrier protein|uniref:Acyl carrier protein n=1 Tax=Actinacidiphila epipremni TaxID=2053013 RepID=A0ABX0ZQN9_9ACTN|nr:acyl carrier protein [Actinacidiphila epipremni]NJP44951.1 acyl carrier protein [Actinacidiphila epipremni]
MSHQVVEPSAEYRDKVSAIVIEELELEEGELTDNGHFIDDYESDSLSLITVVSRIEKELGVAIPSEELGELVNLKALADAVERYAGGNGNG